MSDDTSDEKRGYITIAVPLSYVGADAPVAFANHFSLQSQGNKEWVLTVGLMAVPPVLGTPDDVRAEIQRRGFLAVALHGRYVMTRERLKQLSALLAAQLEASAIEDTDTDLETEDPT